ncbi:MAG: polyprenyl synthetase family protein, partial [Spirochaetaceae bacterium]|jgi:octaprenyl-diphosphate synthase|nr:polyprenyl synthetase family protein [Spirochaetaceae bacterium]
VGKKRGDDIVEGKKSLPVLLYLNRHPEAEAFTARCFTAARAGGTDVPDVEAFIQALAASGVLEEAEKRGRALIVEAGKGFSSPLKAVPDREDCAEARRLLAGFTALIS